MSTNTAKTNTFKRLPTNIVPKLYDLTFEPNFDTFTFIGNSKVSVEVKESTNEIILNSHQLDIIEVYYEQEDGLKVNSQSIKLNKEEELLIIKLENTLLLNTKGILTIKYNGILNDKMMGFYRSKYITTNNKNEIINRYILTTQFCSTYARYAFPSWDEPAVKSIFKVTLIIPKDMISLSNMLPINEIIRKNDEKNIIKFEQTPIMSTYLLAFIIGNFDFVEKQTNNNIRVRVYTSPGKKDQGLFALDIACKSLDFYTKYFNTGYPLSKMDLVAISEFSCGAMENWGLVTFRESKLLIDNENSSTNQKQEVAFTVAHEMAHQWFGNLVTMEWWTDIWLNEGFATFMQFLATDHFLPEYSVWKHFVSNQYSKGLKLDGLNNSHPVEVTINRPSEIDEVFDNISYFKGASIIAMLHNYIGDTAFRDGMSKYLNKFCYKNAVTQDLWNSLESSSCKPVKDIMSSWTKQKGFPIIEVTRSQKDSTNCIIKLSQKKFSSDGKLTENEKTYKWMIPISILSSKSTTSSSSSSTSPEVNIVDYLMCNTDDEILLPNVHSGQWIKLNHKSIGFYRIFYSQSMLEQLLPPIESKLLHPLDRLNIFDDLFALVIAGKVSTVQLLKVFKSYQFEDDYYVWSVLTNAIERLNLLFSNTKFHHKFQLWARSLFKNIRSIGWTKELNEEHSKSLLRLTILSTLVSLNDENTISHGKRLFESHISSTNTISPDVRSIVYNSVAIDANEQIVKSLFKLYRECDFAEERNKISTALGSIGDSVILKKVLDWSIGDEVLNQDSILIIASVASNKFGRDLAWNFFKNNFTLLKERYATLFLGSSLVKSVCSVFASEEKAVEIENFFKNNHFPGNEMAVKQSVETVKISANWLSRDFLQVEAYINSEI